MPAQDRTTSHAHAKSGIYAIRHVRSGKLYIGSAVNISQRWREHRSLLRRGVHHSRHLQGAWNRDGAEAFVFEILEAVGDLASLIAVEQEHLDHFRPWHRTIGYNNSPTAGSTLGFRHRDETRAKISAIVRGRTVGPETRERMSHAQKNRDASTNRKISEALQGKPKSSEHVAKLPRNRKGYTQSPERAERSRAALEKAMEKVRGVPRSPEHIANLPRNRKGYKQSPEGAARSRAALAKAMEAKARLSAIRRATYARERQMAFPFLD